MYPKHMKTKICSRCGRDLPATKEFFFKKSKRTGWLSGCRDCRRIMSRDAYRKRNKISHESLQKLEDFRTWRNKYGLRKKAAQRAHDPIGYYATAMFNSSYRSSLRKKIPHTITKSWIRQQLDKGVCPVTGLHFRFPKPEEGDIIGRDPYRPSLDRIDNTKGYTPDNSRVVLWWYNIAKGPWTEEEIFTLAEAVVRYARR